MQPVTKVHGRPELERCRHATGIIQNTDNDGFNQFIAVRKNQKTRDDKTSKLENEVFELRQLLTRQLNLTGAAHE